MTGAITQWLASPVGRAALEYVEKGYQVVPLHGVTDDLRCTCGKYPCGENNKQAGKHPFTRNGLKDSSNEIAVVASMFQYRGDLNIAIRTGEISGFWVLDVDAGKGGDLAFQELQRIHGNISQTKFTLTGNGYHVWFTYLPEDKVNNGTNVFGKEFPGIDVRGDGGYICAPPSHHYSGKFYEAPEEGNVRVVPAPLWLRDALKEQTKKKSTAQKPVEIDRNSSSGELPDWSTNDVLEMLSFLSADAGYDDWLHVGMSLHHGGFPFSIWDDWSSSGSKYVVNECAIKWKSFNIGGHAITMGTLVDAAKVRGWKPQPIEREFVDTSMVDAMIQQIKNPSVIDQMIVDEKPTALPVKKNDDNTIFKKLPFDPEKMDGLIGDTVRWILKYAMQKQPDLALLNTLAFAGAVFGRQYASEVNTRTNVYTVGIGSTASGKDHSRKMLTYLAGETGLLNFLGGNSVRSDTGMLRSLMNAPSQLMMLDEFGSILKAVGDARSPYHIQMISRAMLTLYSDSGSTYNHGDYADPKSKPIVIKNPNLCLFGTDTESKYVPALRRSAIESGELNRFIALPSERVRKYPPKNLPRRQMDEVLQERWKLFSRAHSFSMAAIMDTSDIAPDPTIVSWGECEELQYAISCKQTDMLNNEENPYHPLWGRYYENCVKIAMILAIARDRENPSMLEMDFDYARAVVESSIEYITSLARNHMADSDHEDQQNAIVRALRTSTTGSMTRRDMLRKFRKIKRKELEEIIAGLIDQEMMTATTPDKHAGGRGTVTYTLT